MDIDASSRPIGVVFMGMFGAFSYTHLAALLAAGLDVRGVIVPGNTDTTRVTQLYQPHPVPESLPIINTSMQPSILHLAWEHYIPAYEVGRLRAPEVHELLQTLAPDVVCVACFPRRLPTSLLELPRFGFLNVHPSLLPLYRGPEPLFWTFRDGQTQTGVTIHAMDAGFDTGPIARQVRVDVPDGISGDDAERRIAERGATALVEVLAELSANNLRLEPQPPGGSAAPTPTPDDFRLSTTWSARRAFNFMRGTARWRMPYHIQIGGTQLTLSTAVGYEPDGTLKHPFEQDGDEILIQFAPGVLYATIQH